MSEAVAQATIDMLVAKDEGVDNAERRTAQASTPTRSVSADLDDAHQRRGERARLGKGGGWYRDQTGPLRLSLRGDRLLGDLVARGTRSSIYAYGRGAVVKVPHPSTPPGWIRFEARYADAARAAGAPVPRLLGIEQLSGRTASVWERVQGTSMWQQVVDRPRRSAELGRLLADVQLALFELVPPVMLPSQRDRLVSKIRWSAATVDSSLARALDLLSAGMGQPRLCHGDLHPSNVILGQHDPMIVDWFDASRGETIADVARTSLTLLGDGGKTPRHLPGSDRRTLASLTEAYLSRLRGPLDIGNELFARWQAIQAVARMAEGAPRDALLDVWRRFERKHDSAHAGHPGSDAEPRPAVQAAVN
jgi:Phosphotransferase enzyme family